MHADRLRLRAIRYLGMAFKAREDGEADFAKRLAERAAELLKEAATLANCSTPEPEASPEPSGHPARPESALDCAGRASQLAARWIVGCVPGGGPQISE